MTDEPSIRNEVRERVWSQLREVARPDSRFAWDFGEFIADYEGSDAGAERLLDLADDHDCESWLVTPDNNLDPLRERLIERPTPFLMPTYGIRRGFLSLDPADVPDGAAAFASVLDGMTRFAERAPLDALEADHPPLDVMVTGASFVTPDGLRMGKGHGFFDLEWAMLRQVGLATEDTLVVAAVHDVQLLSETAAPEGMVADHDTVVDYVVTPTRTHRVEGDRQKPSGIHWGLLTESEIRAIPPLETLWKRAGRPATKEV
ncbi:5-formyltetrahydrofolate cyclo-ligase [Haloplanus pelagicus]|jgi:5-formyltetrahydrofolate cyclo-ligase|uniref:5-formyltetrahydrofolate cyclo-ligase n=1 Tax=Haloplanus pelagicus TaxID=2949995 RepID=UPI00203FD2D1|nr:5-formyltetrahydrofolate cyclo-ligase [Haloplanus sp. HW8-1]